MKKNKTIRIGPFRIFYESLISSKIQFGFIVFAILIAFAFLHWPKSIDNYNNFWDPLISVLTFITALLIGLYSIITDWKNALEKRLTVFFVYYYESLDAIDDLKNGKNNTLIEKGKELISQKSLQKQTPYCLMICEEAFLAHEGDIRNWAQQLGRQLEGENLSFHAFITLGNNNSIVKKSINNHSFFTKQYTMFMYLDTIPNCIIDNKKDKKGILSTDNYDDKPTNTKTNFEIKPINYKTLLDYTKAKQFVDEIR